MFKKWMLASSFLFSINSFANCPVPTEWQELECHGNFRAKNLTQLNNYISGAGIASVSGVDKAKTLIIDFDVNTDNLAIATPCGILVETGKSITTSGNLCINAKSYRTQGSTYYVGTLDITTNEVLRINTNTTINSTGDINLISNNHAVVVHEDSSITGQNILLESKATDQNSRVYIRDRSVVNGESLTLVGELRAVLGKATTFNINDFIKLQVKEEFKTSIWKDTVMNTPRLDISSDEKITILKKPHNNIRVVKFDAPECFIHPNAIIDTVENRGSCFGPAPHAVITSSTTLGEAPLAVNFDMTSSSGPLDKLIIDFGDGTITQSNSLQFNHTYEIPGLYTVKAEYWTATKRRSTVYLQIRATATENTPPIYLLTSQVETGGVISTILSLEDFPNGLNPNDIKYFHYNLGPLGNIRLPQGAMGSDEYGSLPVNYPNSGTYPVNLVVELHNGIFLETGPQNINVWDNTFPVPYYSVSTDHGAAPLTVTFSADDAYSSDGSPITQYRWRFPDGEQRGANLKNVTYTFTENGVYNIRLRTFNAHGNRGQVNIPIYVGVTPPTTGHAPVAYIRADQRLGNAPHTIQFKGDESFDPERGALTYQWNMGEGTTKTVANPTHTYNTPGVYGVSLKVTDQDANENYAFTYVYINNPNDNIPLDFSVNHLGGGQLQLDTTAVVSNQIYDPQSFLWRFDLGNERVFQLTGPNTEANLPGPGTYRVVLSARKINGGYASTQKFITIDHNTEMPQGNLTSTKPTYQFGEPTVLNANISNLATGNLKFKWFTEGYYYEEIGNNQFSYVFPSSGNKKISVIVEDENGFSTVFTHFVNVEISNAIPVASLQTSNYQYNQPAPSTIGLDASSSYDQDGFITNYHFDFGDGTSTNSFVPFVNHTYQNPGTYTAIVTVTDNWGATHSAQQVLSFTENQAPVAQLYLPREIYYTGETINFDAGSSYDPDGHISLYSWNFGDGNNANINTPLYQYTYSTIGNFIVELSVMDNSGSVSNISKSIEIKQNLPPTAKFIIIKGDTPVLPRTITIDASISTDPNGNISSYEIYVNDLLIGTNSIESYIVNEPDNYNIKVRVVDTGGLTSEISKTLYITDNRPPVAVFEFNKESYTVGEILVGDAVGSTDPDEDDLEYEWNWGDGSTGQGVVASHYYSEIGEYTVVLKVRDHLGEESEVQKTFNITEGDVALPIPVISFVEQQLMNAENPIYTHALASKSNIGASIVEYRWDMGDGTIYLNQSTVTHRYQELGNYTISLTIKDEFDQVSTVYESIKVTREKIYNIEKSNASPITMALLDIEKGIINELPQNIRIGVSEATDNFDASSMLAISVNGIDIENIVVTGQELIVSSESLINGLNYIEVSGQDENGDIIHFYNQFVLGSEEVTVTVKDEGQNVVPGAYVTILFEEDGVKALKQLQADTLGNVTFNNGIYKNTAIFASSAYKSGFLDNLSLDQSSYEISIKNFNSENYSGNNNFSENFRGWELSDAELFNVEDNGFSLSLSETEAVSYRKITNLTTEIAAAINHTFKLATQRKYKVIGIVRSVATNEISFTLNQEVSGDQSLVVSGEFEDKGDYELYVKIIPLEIEEQGLFQRFVSLFQQQEDDHLDGDNLNTPRIVTRYYDYNRFSEKQNQCRLDELDHYVSIEAESFDLENALSPSLFIELREIAGCNPNSPVTIYPLGILVRDGSRRVALYRPENNAGIGCLYNTTRGGTLQGACNAFPSNGKIKFSLLNNDYDTAYVEGLKEGSDVEKQRLSLDFVWTTNRNDYLEGMSSFTCNSNGIICEDHGSLKYPLILYSRNLGRYNTDDDIADSLVGGDRWINPKIFNDLLTVNDTMSSYQPAFGDASNANGGKFDPHGAHQKGKNVDITINGFNSNTLIDRKLFYGLEKIFDDIADTKWLHKIGITLNHENKKRFKESDFGDNFDQFLKQSCIGHFSGSTVFKDLENHTGHIHLEFYQKLEEKALTFENTEDLNPINARIVTGDTDTVFKDYLELDYEVPSDSYIDVIFQTSPGSRRANEDKVVYQKIGSSFYKDPFVLPFDFIDATSKNNGSTLSVKIKKNEAGGYEHPALDKIKLRRTRFNGTRCSKFYQSLPIVSCLENSEQFIPNLHLGTRHENGGGFVSMGAQVNPQTFIEMRAEVCSNVVIKDNVDIFGKVKIKGNTIIEKAYISEEAGGENYLSIGGNSGTVTIKGKDNTNKVGIRSGSGLKIQGNVQIEGGIDIMGNVQIDSLSSSDQVQIKNPRNTKNNIYTPIMGGNSLIQIQGNTTIEGGIDIVDGDNKTIKIDNSQIKGPSQSGRSYIMDGSEVLNSSVGLSNRYFSLLNTKVKNGSNVMGSLEEHVCILTLMNLTVDGGSISGPAIIDGLHIVGESRNYDNYLEDEGRCYYYPEPEEG